VPCGDVTSKVIRDIRGHFWFRVVTPVYTIWDVQKQGAHIRRDFGRVTSLTLAVPLLFTLPLSPRVVLAIRSTTLTGPSMFHFPIRVYLHMKTRASNPLCTQATEVLGLPVPHWDRSHGAELALTPSRSH
jgi:hypothetical protein